MNILRVDMTEEKVMSEAFAFPPEKLLGGASSN